MNQSEFFAKLGAPLHNVRWSWGAIRERDGAVFLRVWIDQLQVLDDALFVRVIRRPPPDSTRSKPGRTERRKHVGLIRAGAHCFLILCEAADPAKSPRDLVGFVSKYVFPGGRLVDLDGETWIEVLPGVPADELMSDISTTALTP